MTTISERLRRVERGAEFTGLYGPVNRLLLLVGALLLKVSVQLTVFDDSLVGAVLYYLAVTVLVPIALVGWYRLRSAEHSGRSTRNGGGVRGRFQFPSLAVSVGSDSTGRRNSSLGRASASPLVRLRRRLASIRPAVPWAPDEMDRL
ncbi:hypothetical protein [Haloarchaeobius sp. HME9146]|uniref:hypothetical protein n=1 Tax=Haloarchaeobius sp. HME9146 TaxID=2978732 RepID=UPI0021BE2A8A|nr:hypothetical protein [Haloarchaeobius sp. HME9146]MCT9096138.1 hypothetical protein [Haloarchaeobius sp. HME9146]